MPILKQILEWQVEHPNITWIGWGAGLGRRARPLLLAAVLEEVPAVT